MMPSPRRRFSERGWFPVGRPGHWFSAGEGDLVGSQMSNFRAWGNSGWGRIERPDFPEP